MFTFYYIKICCLLYSFLLTEISTVWIQQVTMVSLYRKKYHLVGPWSCLICQDGLIVRSKLCFKSIAYICSVMPIIHQFTYSIYGEIKYWIVFQFSTYKKERTDSLIESSKCYCDNSSQENDEPQNHWLRFLNECFMRL